MVRLAHFGVEGGSSLSTPAQLGYRMPAEWEPHAGTWITWPRREGISFPDHYDRIPPILATMVRVLADDEGVFINVWDADMEAEVRKILTQHNALNDRVEFYHHPAYEPWCRDHGPVFVIKDTSAPCSTGVTTRGVKNTHRTIWTTPSPNTLLPNAACLVLRRT